MPENKKYYYLKLKENFFETEEMVVLQGLKDGYLYSDILLKLYLHSLKGEGRLSFKNLIPYTPDMLAQLTRHQTGTVERALKIFQQLGLVEILDNGTIFMSDIQNFIGKTSNEGDRIREYRNRIKKEREANAKLEECYDDSRYICNNNCNDECDDMITPEIRDKSSENREQSIDTSSNEEVCKSPGSVRATIPYRQIQEMFNSICAHFPKCQALSDRRKKAIKARFENGMTVDDFKKLFEKAEASSFLRGKNDRDWQASFDWLIKDANMVKVLDGNYDNRGGNDYGRNVGAQAAGRNPIGRFEEIPGGVQL